MKRHLKRLTALLMTAVLVASMLSSGAMAAETADTSAEVVSEEESADVSSDEEGTVAENNAEDGETSTEDADSVDGENSWNGTEEGSEEIDAVDGDDLTGDAADAAEDLEDDGADAADGTETSENASSEEAAEESGTDESNIAAVSAEAGEEVSSASGEEAAVAEESSEEVAAEESEETSFTVTTNSNTTYTYSSEYIVVDSTNKTITVSQSSDTAGYEIQAALNYLNSLAEGTTDDSEGDEDGWTIIVNTGTYARFTVYATLDNLTIKAADDAEVIINVLDGSDAPVATSGAYPDTGGVSIRDCEGLTLSGLTFQSADDALSSPWYAAAVCDYVETTTKADGLTVTDCTFAGTGGNYGLFICGMYSWTVEDCSFDSYYGAISFMCDNQYVVEVVITGNTFTDCDYTLMESYYGAEYETAGTFTFTNNTVTGTADDSTLIVILNGTDDYDSIGNVTFEGNIFTYASVVFGNSINVDLEDIVEDNTFNENSYVASGGDNEITCTFTGTTVDENGYWVLSVDYSESGLCEETYGDIAEIIKAANAAGLTTFTIDFSKINLTYTDGDTTKTYAYHYIIKKLATILTWVSIGEEPEVTKSVSESKVCAGDTVEFSLVVSGPEYLDYYVDGTIGSGSYELTVHDEMDSVLELDADSIVVAIEDAAMDSSYYTVTTSDLEDKCTFEITTDLVELVEAGVFVADSDGTYPDIVITYTATVSEDADAGSYDNTTWLTYESDGESDPSTVTVTVPEPEEEVEEEEEETTTTTTTKKKSKSYSSSGSSSTTTTTSTQTSDSANMALWLVLAAVAAAGAAGAGVYGWRRKRE